MMILQHIKRTFLKVPATVQDTANAAVLIASDRGRMLTGTVGQRDSGHTGLIAYPGISASQRRIKYV